MTHPVETAADSGEGFKPSEAVFIAKEDVLAPVAARGDVIEGACEFES